MPAWGDARSQASRSSAARVQKLGEAIGRVIRSCDADQRVGVVGTGGLTQPLDGKCAGFIDRDFDMRFMDSLIRAPTWATKYSITHLVEPTGTQGVELRVWLATRGALGDKVRQVRRNHHVPVSDTAAGTSALKCR